MPMHPHRPSRPSASRHATRRAGHAGGWLRRCGGGLAHGIAGLLVVLMLFSRVAVAAYACPAAVWPAVAAGSSAAELPCGAMDAGLPDTDQPLLCLQHCAFGHGEQSGQQWAAAVAPPAQAPGGWPLLPVDASRLAGTAMAQQPRERERPPPLPLRTALCCLRP